MTRMVFGSLPRGGASPPGEPGSMAAKAPLEAHLPELEPMSPIDLIETEHRKWLIVCDAMERVADELPDLSIDPRVLGTASLCTREAVARHHAAEQDGLFPLIKARLDPSSPLASMLDCLEEDHADLEDASDEAADILAQIRLRQLRLSPDAAGYALRCFFAFMRRHVRCELHIVLPAARALIPTDDVGPFAATLARHRRHEKIVPLEWFRRYAAVD